MLLRLPWPFRSIPQHTSSYIIEVTSSYTVTLYIIVQHIIAAAAAAAAAYICPARNRWTHVLDYTLPQLGNIHLSRFDAALRKGTLFILLALRVYITGSLEGILASKGPGPGQP